VSGLRFFWIFFFLFSSLAGAAEPSSQSSIDLKEKISVPPHTTLSLLDLVDQENSGNFAAIKDKLARRAVMVLQEEGERIGLSSQSVVQHLKSALAPEERDLYRFSIPRRIQITVTAPALTEASVKALLISKWQKLCGECRVEISNLRLPLGKLAHWHLEVPENLPSGSFNLPITVKAGNGAMDATYWLQGKADVLRELPVAQRALYPGERVRAEDFTYRWQSVTHAVDGPPEKNFLVGMKVKIPVAANQVIWSRNLEKEKALSRGDQVRVILKQGSWELSLSAIAEKDAEVGDTITLKNPSTKKELIGLVVGKGEVQVQ